MAPEIQNEHAIETYKSLIQISVEVMKLLALLNGGAAVALLAYLGNVAGKGGAVPNMRVPMLSYLVGLVLCGITFFLSYLTQLHLYREDVAFVTRERHVILQIAALGCGLLSLVAFAVGSGFAAFRFQ